MVAFLNNGNPATPCVGCAPTMNWDYAELSLNHTLLVDDINTNQPNKTQSTAAHEFGHGVALAHASPQMIIMYYSISRYTAYGIYTPQWNDSFNVDMAY